MQAFKYGTTNENKKYKFRQPDVFGSAKCGVSNDNKHCITAENMVHWHSHFCMVFMYQTKFRQPRNVEWQPC